MKILTNKIVITAASIILLHGSSSYAQETISTELLTVAQDAVRKTEKPTPDELKKRLNPMVVEVEKNKGSINEDFLNQLLNFAYLASTKLEENPQAPALKQEIQGLAPAIEGGKFNPKKLTHQEKADAYNSLSLPSRMFIFEYIGDRLFTEKKPFEIPQGTKNISQLDMFFLLTIALTYDAAEKDPVWAEFHRSLMSCVNAKEVFKITAQLQKNKYLPLLPMSIQNKLFSKNISVLFVIKERIKTLSSLYE